MHTQIDCEDKALKSPPAAFQRVVELAEIVLDDDTASREDLHGIIAQIHAVAIQSLINADTPIKNDWPVRTNSDDVHKAQRNLARRAAAIRSDYLEMIQAGWRIETFRKQLDNGNFSVYARYRRGSGKLRQSKYIGLVFSGRDG